MDVGAFLRDCRAQWPEFDRADALADIRHPVDRRLAGLPSEVEGFATENKLMLLNLAARHLGESEVYVEVGCWKGLTLAGAAQGNPNATIYACDDFSRMGASRELVQDALDRFTLPGQVQFHDMDFRRFMEEAPWRPARVGVYFYDGGHSFHDQFQALELIKPYLSADALVIIDDTNDLPVRRANDLFLRYNREFELVTDVLAREYQDLAWWNGVQVLRYRAPRPAPAGQSPADAVPAGRYLVERALWNRGVFYTQRIARLATTGRRATRNTLSKAWNRWQTRLGLEPDSGETS